MKNFVIRLVVFLVPIIVFFGLMEISLRNIPNDYSFKKKYLDNNSNNIEVLYLGSSHVYYGVNPEFSNYASFNAAHISQSLDYDLAILNKYKNCWNSLRYIILPVDYFSLYSTLKDGKEKWRVKNYALYYGIENKNLRGNFELLNGRFSSNFKRIKDKLVENKTDVTSNKLGWGFTNNSRDAVDLLKSGKMAAERHTKIKNIETINNNIKTLNEIIQFADTQKVKVIFFTAPAFNSYVNNLNKEQLSNTISIIKKISSGNNNINYFNLLGDDSFTNKDFYDADHLNERGAYKLTLKLDSIIAETL